MAETPPLVGSSPVDHPDESPFTFVAVPDTQKYSETDPAPFDAITSWIRDNVDAERIALVLHEGDVVNGPDAEPEQFERATAAIECLEETDVPLVLAIGNHDYDTLPGRSATAFEKVFPTDRFADRSWWGGTADGTCYNAYVEFETADESWLAFALELFPRERILAWADDVIAAHPDHHVAICTHGYLYHDGTPIDEGDRWSKLSYGVTGHNGDELWDRFVSRHPGIEFVVSGHVLCSGNAYRRQLPVDGSPVHQLLANYQSLDGGRGYLTLVRWYRDADALTVETYSPMLEQFHPNPDLHFRVDHAFTPDDRTISGRFVNTRK